MSKATQTNIKKLLSITGVTHKQLGQIAGVDRTAVSHWVHGTSEPRMGAIQRMADHFGLMKSNFIEAHGMDHIARGVDGRLVDTATAQRHRTVTYSSKLPDALRPPNARGDDTEKIQRLYEAVADTLLTDDESRLVTMYQAMDDEGKSLLLATAAAFVASHPRGGDALGPK